MAEPAKYVVSCFCAGAYVDVAIIDDDRPAGGHISIRGPRGYPPDRPTFQMVAVNPPFRFQNRPDLNARIENLIPYANAAAEKKQSDYEVTQTIWKDGHQSWAIRCMKCKNQVQLSQGTLLAVMDALLAARAALESRLTVDPGTAAKRNMRHVVPLGVLHRMVLHIDG